MKILKKGIKRCCRFIPRQNPEHEIYIIRKYFFILWNCLINFFQRNLKIDMTLCKGSNQYQKRNEEKPFCDLNQDICK